ncbi:hypothetical protein T03_17969 [Trichinella britovi]|uniref:Uncharacterized protein n=1 Tax=Trichinella britovi TaxID=45882 RepID=A0A0V1APC7_TRIBR|nr:hypothetical protein T03_17969 [Trichinella britovi]
MPTILENILRQKHRELWNSSSRVLYRGLIGRYCRLFIETVCSILASNVYHSKENCKILPQQVGTVPRIFSQ